MKYTKECKTKEIIPFYLIKVKVAQRSLVLGNPLYEKHTSQESRSKIKGPKNRTHEKHLGEFRYEEAVEKSFW